MNWHRFVNFDAIAWLQQGRRSKLQKTYYLATYLLDRSLAIYLNQEHQKPTWLPTWLIRLLHWIHSHA